MSEKKLLVLTPEQLTIKSGEVPRFEGQLNSEDIIGQEAALSLLEPWLTLPKTGESDYERAHDNVLLFGPPETGRLAKVERFARAVAAKTENPPPDTVAIPRISDPMHPMILLLPAGSGKILAAAAQTALNVTTRALPIMLKAMLSQANDRVSERAELILEQMEEKLNEIGFAISETEGKDGVVSIKGPFPIDSEGNPLTEADIAKLSEAERADLEARREKATEICQTAYSTIDAIQTETSSDITEKAMKDCGLVLHRKMEPAVVATGPDPQVIAYALELQKMLIASAVAKLAGQSSNDMEEVIKKSATVKVLQDNTGVKHAPVVVAKFPKFAKLFGRIGRQRIDDDHVVTDHTMIDGGYITAVNGGGTLIVVLDDLLNAPYGSTALNKLIGVVNDGKMRIENIASYLGVESYETNFCPDEIPVNFRLILVCSTQWGMWLRDHPMFRNNFRINIEFDGSMPAELADLSYAKFVALCEDRDGLPKFTPEAIGRLREYGHRLVESQKRVSTKFGILKDVIAEAGKAARNDGSETTEKKHVWKAIRTQMRRRGNWTRQQRRYEDEILRFTTEGTKVGCINALVVRGGYLPEAIGGPSTLAARAYKGKGGPLLVQRLIDTSGPSTNQSMEILDAWLLAEFAAKVELNRTVKLSFEQNYGGIDGDSASLAETLATLSALSGLPLRQDLAITGSMNLNGDAQAIGGVNLKIEGFYDYVKRNGGIKPGHGVVIPFANMQHLLLREDVIEAVREGNFTVTAVDDIWSAAELFFQMPREEIRKKLIENIRGKKSWLARLFGKK